MTSNAAIDRYAGAAGYDWANHQYDTVAADDDMAINHNLIGVPLPVVVNRDRWQEVEANSGSAFNDVIRGDDAVPSTVGGAGFSGCDVLDQAGIDRIAGLDSILPTPTTPLGPVEAASPMGACPLTGPVWGDGNILLGGLGSDTLEGRGANDVIDGDRYLKVRISVRTNGPAVEIGSTDLMEHTYQTGNPKTLAADVAAGVIDPGNLVAMREIITPTAAQAAGNLDSARVLRCDGELHGHHGRRRRHARVTRLDDHGDRQGVPTAPTPCGTSSGWSSPTPSLRAPRHRPGLAGNAQATVNLTAPAASPPDSRSRCSLRRSPGGCAAHRAAGAHPACS